MYEALEEQKSELVEYMKTTKLDLLKNTETKGKCNEMDTQGLLVVNFRSR